MHDGLRHANEYLAKHQHWRALPGVRAHPELGLVVVIPCHDEPDVLATLESLRRCTRPRAAVETLLIVNASQADDDAVRARNRASVDAARRFAARVDEARFRYHVLEYQDLPARHAGVGLARKIGMDAALGRFVAAGNPRGIIASLDADCTCDHDYLSALESHFERNPAARACSIYFEHALEGPLCDTLYAAITHYELFLRYYRHGLAYAAFPYAHYTVGSCMAVRSDAYARHGGMNRRKAGEDFYFLNKLMAVGGVGELTTTRVMPGVRTSHRVPFGTGRALGRRLAGGDGPWLAYDARVFRDLAALVASVDEMYAMPPAAWRRQAQLSEPMADFLSVQGMDAKHAQIHANCASPESFRKRFFQWFDAFRALKFIHYASARAYPREPLEQACSRLLRWQGVAIGDGARARDLLRLLRERDRAPRPSLTVNKCPLDSQPA